MSPGTKKTDPDTLLAHDRPPSYKDKKSRVKRLYILMAVAHAALVQGRMTETRVMKLFVEGHIISDRTGGDFLG